MHGVSASAVTALGRFTTSGRASGCARGVSALHWTSTREDASRGMQGHVCCGMEVRVEVRLLGAHLSVDSRECAPSLSRREMRAAFSLGSSGLDEGARLPRIASFRPPLRLATLIRDSSYVFCTARLLMHAGHSVPLTRRCSCAAALQGHHHGLVRAAARPHACGRRRVLW
jgi:hypothetical protein